MDKTSDKSRRYKWTLYAGIVLWVIGLVGGLIASGGRGAEGQLFLLLSIKRSWFLSFLLYVVGLPCIIEGVYRYWGEGKKTQIWVSLVCMVLSTIVIIVRSNGVWGTAHFGVWGIVLSVVSMVIMAVLVVLALRRRQGGTCNYVFFIVGSTFIWIVYYLLQLQTLPEFVALDIAKLVGLSFVCCYLVINYKIMYAIVAHTINNAIVALPIVLAGVACDTAKTEIDGVSVSLQRVYTVEEMNTVRDGRVVMQGNLTQFVAHFASRIESRNVMVVPCRGEDWLYYRLEAGPEQTVRPGTLLSAMEKMGYIVMDTTFEGLWTLDMRTDMLPRVKESHAECQVALGDLVSWIRSRYVVPIALRPEVNPQLTVELPPIELMNRYGKTFDDFVNYVGRSGITISQEPYEKACVVRVRRPWYKVKCEQ